MSGRQSREHGHPKFTEVLVEQSGQQRLRAGFRALVEGESSKQDSGGRLQFSAERELGQITVDTVNGLIHILEKQDASGRFDFERRSHEPHQHGNVAAG